MTVYVSSQNLVCDLIKPDNRRLANESVGGQFCFQGVWSKSIYPLKSTGRDRSWTEDYAACGCCHLAHAA